MSENKIKHRVKPKNKPKIKKGRLFVIALGISALFVGLIGRLIYLMGFEGVEYRLIALKRQIKNIEIAPQRGTIVDRNGSELATSLKVYRIDADLSVLKSYLEKAKLSEEAVTEDLADILDMDKAKMKKIMDSKDSNGEPLQFVSLKRMAEMDTVEKVKALKLKGIIISDDIKRFYPNESFLANVLGHINMNGDPVTGIELSYNQELTGMPGVKVVETDAVNNSLPYTESVVIEPINGKSIMLTIDERIQELAERVAKKTLEDNKAASVRITIMDPKTGEVLAMVNYPSYDPNNPNAGADTDQDIQELWKNRAISDVFEPGSIFKVITAAAALHNHSLEGGKEFYCSGSITVAGITLYCDKREGHGLQDISDIIKNSCNVGFVQLAEKIGKENLYNYLKLMGFSTKTGVDLPGESAGVVRSLDNIGPVDIATIAYGHGLAVTQLQYLAAFNAVANGGTWIRPHLMKEVYHYQNGEKVVDKQYDNYDVRTVLSKDQAAELRTYMEKVVKEGTSTATDIPGYRIAGKTGTASKVDTVTGGYLEGKYISSFAGMAPADDPKVTLIVTIEEPDPEKYYASLTAVPAARQLFEELFTIMGIYPSYPEEVGKEAAKQQTKLD
ncbi:peptidoglycan D,D-transpeptidase FtsI family protein [Clostridium thermarum]|uniref:peptidoglycan D,D-transpeptidase FtsI family protein n=1 Tax=Clostridium thermarum TaxID=1716543 RepID=UPI00111FCC64|nr:penicillin-binding transpeptidase domain-containing protein [Clostridium thermarum]